MEQDNQRKFSLTLLVWSICVIIWFTDNLPFYSFFFFLAQLNLPVYDIA